MKTKFFSVVLAVSVFAANASAQSVVITPSRIKETRFCREFPHGDKTC